ncbi:hypothetical protein KAH94_02905, partial [bacterium]|nr:hypothetical protein [bacterium]
MPNSRTYSWILDVKANTNKIVSGFKSVVRGTDKVESNVKGINKAATKTVSTFKSIAGAAGLAFGAAQVISFTKDLIKLSGEVEGVDRAFNQIADKDYLESLKKSTAGTVSELSLMKRAVQANNFQIPLQDLGKLFEFATARAQQTGESVDFLVDSIVTSIGRKCLTGETLVLTPSGIKRIDEFSENEKVLTLSLTGQIIQGAIKGVHY